jgi:hypothetical protein
MNTIETMTNMEDQKQKHQENIPLLKELNAEYNELYPQYLDSYKRWKSLVSGDRTIAGEEAYNEHAQLENKLNNINNQLLKYSMKEAEDANEYNDEIKEQNQQLENNEKKIEKTSTTNENLNETLGTSNSRIEDYQILNRNMGVKVVLWIFVALVILFISLMMAYKFHKL